MLRTILITIPMTSLGIALIVSELAFEASKSAARHIVRRVRGEA